MGKGSITDVSGIRVGHYTDLNGGTGCTVILCKGGATGGVDVRGSAPGTRETELLRPTSLVSKVHAILLSGGSAFGLDAASGVMRYLEAEGIGLKFGGATIPIVPSAILFDLGVITNEIRPGPREGYLACQSATSETVLEGSVGAGTGATVGGMYGLARAMKGGIGTSSIHLGRGLVVGALVAVNAMGSIFDAGTGKLVAGPRSEDGSTVYDTMKLMLSPEFSSAEQHPSTNTTIGVVATNVTLDKAQTNKLASVAHNGLARSIKPVHTMSDGDTMFTLATGELKQSINMDRLCAASAHCVSEAVLRGVRNAKSLGGIPSLVEVERNGQF